MMRSRAVDHLRGVVMALMVVDHVRYFFLHAGFDPLDVTRTSAALFFTRWVTHFCAPTFMLLAGVGAGLSRRSRPDLTKYLLLRGLLLVLLELTAAHLGWTFSLSYAVVEALVFWALGVSMMVMAGLLWLPRAALTVIVFVTLAGHNLLDGTRFDIVALHAPGAVEWGDHRVEFVYPIVPWPAVMAAGYLLAPHLAHAKKLGAALILAFLLVRGIDIYGDPHPWRPHLGLVLATTKYPPSLAFLLMTLGPALVALPFLERPSFLVVIGRVPLFFWLLHVPLIHALSKLFPEASGVLAVWLLSALVIALLYVPCRIFAALKETRRYAWLAYV